MAEKETFLIELGNAMKKRFFKNLENCAREAGNNKSHCDDVILTFSDCDYEKAC